MVFYVLTEIAYIYNGNYITPWGIGVATILLYGLAAYSIVLTFNLKDKWLCAALGTILITFPTVTSNNLYIFTAHYYAIAFLLACCSVCVVNRWDKPYAIGVGAILLCSSLGIYQAYLPFVLTMYVLIVLLECTDSSINTVDIMKKSTRLLISLILGLVLYFGINKIFLQLTNKQMGNYMGMDSMGKLSLQTLSVQLIKCYKCLFHLFGNTN